MRTFILFLFCVLSEEKYIEKDNSPNILTEELYYDNVTQQYFNRKDICVNKKNGEIRLFIN